ncbi:MAG TPA: STAS domain-containing protein [Anaerolineales bacterium]|nr:STAS domain-containing protein [Anaerolineales bacterium]
MSELTIRSSKVQGRVPLTILHLNGHLHGPAEPYLLDHARQAHEDGTRHLLLDLSGVDVITSAGLRAIHVIFNMFTPQSDVETMRQHAEPYKSPYLKLVCPNPQVYYVLSIVGFLQNIPIYPNVEDAVNSFS